MAHSPEKPIYFGSKFKKFVKQGYMSGGSGYVLSRQALRKFIEDAIPNSNLCESKLNGDEDLEIGKCLEAVGVIAGDSRSANNRHRFLPLMPENHLTVIEDKYVFLKNFVLI